jgi:uncharacterized membrane protein YfcA
LDSSLDLAVGAVAVAAFAQAVTGIGFGLVSGPLLVSTLGAGRGVSTTLLLAVLASAVPLVAGRRHVEPRRVLPLLGPALLATPLAALTLHDLDRSTAMVLAGLATLAGAGMLASGGRWRRAAGPTAATAAGALSAAMNYLGGVGGPAAVLYATNAGWPVATTRAALQAYLLPLNLITLAALGLPAAFPVALPIALAVGSVAGVAVAGRIPERPARAATLALAAAGGASAVLRALL